MKALTWKATFTVMSFSPLFEAVAEFAERLTISHPESRSTETGRAAGNAAASSGPSE
jgi:hypothetical protein